MHLGVVMWLERESHTTLFRGIMSSVLDPGGVAVFNIIALTRPGAVAFRERYVQRNLPVLVRNDQPALSSNTPC